MSLSDVCPDGKINILSCKYSHCSSLLQTIIGYGNISPFTPGEWWVASVIMLLAGIMWAYVIGGLVSVVAGMNKRTELYGERLDQANKLIQAIPDPDSSDDEEEDDPKYRFTKRAVSKRIKRYVHNQFNTSNRGKCQQPFYSNVFESFPILETLTPELQESGSLLVMKKYLEAVPYLSCKYLTAKEQAAIAMQCSFAEFSTGETAQPSVGIGNLGSGLIVIDRGLALCSGGLYESNGNRFNLVTVGMAFGASEVLVVSLWFIFVILSISPGILTFMHFDGLLVGNRKRNS